MSEKEIQNKIKDIRAKIEDLEFQIKYFPIA